MDIEGFIASRRSRWARLEELLTKAGNTTERDFGYARIAELVRLYRQTCSDLNQARSFTANPELLGRLNLLTGQGYRYLYRGRTKPGRRRSIVRFFLVEIPSTFRRESAFVLTAAAALLLGAVVGAAAVFSDSSNAHRLIPGDFFTESPRERVEQIENGHERINSVGKAAGFGAYLYTHNIQVAFLAFSLGALTIVGGYLLLFYNGVILGAVAASYFLDGVQLFFFAWVGPHGALEIPAIVFGAAAGLRAGQALLLPGDQSVESSVRASFPAIWRMMAATACTLVLAGLIEGSFSQFSAKTFPYPLKISVAVILFLSLVTFLFGRKPSSGEELP